MVGRQNDISVENKELRRQIRAMRGDTTTMEELNPEEVEQELEDIIEEMNQIVDLSDRYLSFRLHDETETLMTQVINMNTEEIIREMPPEEMLDLSAKISRMVGLILDETV